MGINWVVFFAQIVNLFVLVWLLKKFLYRPIINAVEKRQAEIIGKVNKAKEEYALAEKDHKELAKKLKNFEATKKKEFDKASKEIEEFKTHQMTLIKEEAHKLRQKMQEDLNRQVDSLHTQIRETLADNFVVLAKKMMHELSSESAFCGSLALFQKRLTALSKTDINKIKKSYEKQNIVSISSSETLSKKMQEELAKFLSKTFDWPLPLKMRFETDKNLILGFEMTIGDQSVEWNLKSYLDEYQTKLNTSLSQMIVKE